MPSAPDAESAEKPKQKSNAREMVEALVIAVILALFIRAFIIQAFKIPSSSMEPTLLIGDYLLVNKFIYGIQVPFTEVHLFRYRHPQRGEVMVFAYPGDKTKDYIKRVIGVGGDEVRIVNKKVYINNKPVVDEHAHFQDQNYLSVRDNFGPVTVPPGQLFVMGDNRDNSHDSRFWGFVPLDNVKGKAIIIYWSWDGGLKEWRYKRVGSLIY